MKLENKKEKLWISKEISKWELPQDLSLPKEELLSNEKFSKSLMCASDNLTLKKMKERWAFFNKNLLTSIQTSMTYSLKLHKDNYYQLIHHFLGSFNKVFHSISWSKD